MFTLLRKLPRGAEFCLVIAVCAWWGIGGSIRALVQQRWKADIQPMGHFSGIGIELGTKDNHVIIANVLPNTPAAAAGLSRGWIIQKIDGTSMEGKTAVECGNLARGPAGSTMKLELVNPAFNKTNTVEVTRGTIDDAGSRLKVTDRTLWILMPLELFGLAVMYGIARVRGWPLAEWGFRPSWKYIGAGILLFLFFKVAFYGYAKGFDAVWPGVLLNRRPYIHVSIAMLIPFAALNAFFEEVLESGYFIQFFQRHGLWVAILASAAFRAFLHAYQGINALLIIFPFGLLFAFIYWKWRRLWPLFVAHFLFDMYAFFPR